MVTKSTIELRLLRREGLPIILRCPLNSGIELAVFVKNKWS
jgi:hypothetical protein